MNLVKIKSKAFFLSFLRAFIEANKKIFLEGEDPTVNKLKGLSVKKSKRLNTQTIPERNNK